MYLAVNFVVSADATYYCLQALHDEIKYGDEIRHQQRNCWLISKFSKTLHKTESCTNPESSLINRKYLLSQLVKKENVKMR